MGICARVSCRTQLPPYPRDDLRRSWQRLVVGAGSLALSGKARQAKRCCLAPVPPSWSPLYPVSRTSWPPFFLSQHGTVVTATVPRSPQPSPSQKVMSAGPRPPHLLQPRFQSALGQREVAPAAPLAPSLLSAAPSPPWLVDCGRVTGPGISQAFARRCGGGKPAHRVPPPTCAREFPSNWVWGGAGRRPAGKSTPARPPPP